MYIKDNTSVKKKKKKKKYKLYKHQNVTNQYI